MATQFATQTTGYGVAPAYLKPRLAYLANIRQQPTMATLRKLFLCFGRKQRTNTEEDIEIPKLTPAPAKNAPKAQIPTARARPRPAHVPDFRAAAERQQSEQSPSQSQSDATEPATKPQSMGSSTKPESDSDDKGPVKASSQSPEYVPTGPCLSPDVKRDRRHRQIHAMFGTALWV